MEYDVAIIGGGPSGMMAAGRAGEKGARVVLIEKNNFLGRKLSITGKGRCNITNKGEELREFINNYGNRGQFLFSAFSKFGPSETTIFFQKLGVETKVERGGRVFPLSDESKDIINALCGYLKKSGADILFNSEIKKIVSNDNKIEKVVLANGKEIGAKSFIICTGGKSYPATGSTGQGYEWAKKLGHKITNLLPSLTPIIVKEKFIGELEGLSLKNVEISLFKNGKKIDSKFGEALFTAEGLSGPIILDLSRQLGKELPGDLKLSIDFKPRLDFSKLDLRIQRDFQKNSNRMFKNSLGDLLPLRLIPIILNLSEISPEKKVNSVTKEERKKLARLLKEFVLNVKSLAGFDRAIITAGGVDLAEIDQKTMRSKLIENLYFAGEILDVDGPSGGYNLQVCWTTGYVAGESAAPPNLIRSRP